MHANVLRYFVEVARCGSIRKAAQNLYVASSAVNRQILKLESEMGTELFDRLPNGIRLNAAGERVLQHIRGTLNDFHLMRSELDELKGERKGHVSVVAMDSLFVDFLPATVEEFSDAYPAVTYSIAAVPPHDVPPRVLSGEYDVGIAYITKLPAGLDVVTEVPLPPGVVMASSHPLARRERVTFEECRHHAFLRLEGRSPIQGVMSNDFPAFWESLQPSVTCNSTTLLKRLIASGRGISFFSKLAFLDELSRGDVVWRPIDDENINELTVGIIVPNQRVLPHVTGEFVERIVRRLKHVELTLREF
ncbi:transcriptional regulator [Burkholderia sp. SFA1]|uniref:LysR family transcriptional regulator n=1 Tax=Caballeronia sp. CLC5 TaxID=2906764 RepID=UPI001F256FF5|nr:LysR family transcriptional regulator [Caballeronia sp. CLC5]MCE4574560.1 LysR family transcriptional regulator [Caballeronia sp. CLC5]BBP99941.1 transcriptional regulator [Burkholderia sp. SFA1]